MLYPVSPVSGEQVVSLSVRGFWQALRSTFWCICIFVALKSLYSHLPALPSWLAGIFAIIITLITIFLYIFSLYRVDGQWRGNLLSLEEAWHKTSAKILKVYLTCLGIVAVLLLIFFLVRWLTFSVANLQAASAGVVMLMFAAIPMISILIYFYLMLPLLTVYEKGWYLAFYQSALCARENFVMMLVIYCEMIIILTISFPYTRHSQWLLHHHLMEVCDLVTFSLMTPLLLNLTLLLLHNEFGHQNSDIDVKHTTA
jgi:hypothetical protein